MNLKREACQGCEDRCWFGKKIGTDLNRSGVELRGLAKRTSPSKRAQLEEQVLLRARDRLSQGLQAAHRGGCPSSEINRINGIALRRISPALARAKVYGIRISPSAPSVAPSRLRIPEITQKG